MLAVLEQILSSLSLVFFNIFIIENYITDPEHTIGCNATNQISLQSALILQNKWKRRNSAIHSMVFRQTLFLLHLSENYILLQSKQCTVKSVLIFCIIFAWVLFQANQPQLTSVEKLLKQKLCKTLFEWMKFSYIICNSVSCHQSTSKKNLLLCFYMKFTLELN